MNAPANQDRVTRALLDLSRGNSPSFARRYTDRGEFAEQLARYFDRLISAGGGGGGGGYDPMSTEQSGRALQIAAHLEDPILAVALIQVLAEHGGDLENNDISSPHAKVLQTLENYRAEWREFLNAWKALDPAQPVAEYPELSTMVLSRASPYAPEQLGQPPFSDKECLFVY